MVWFEGHSLQVVLTLQGLNDFSDWRAQGNIDIGRTLLKSRPFLSINFVNRNYNFCAHNLAAWADKLMNREN